MGNKWPYLVMGIVIVGVSVPAILVCLSRRKRPKRFKGRPKKLKRRTKKKHGNSGETTPEGEYTSREQTDLEIEEIEPQQAPDFAAPDPPTTETAPMPLGVDQEDPFQKSGTMKMEEIVAAVINSPLDEVEDPSARREDESKLKKTNENISEGEFNTAQNTMNVATDDQIQSTPQMGNHAENMHTDTPTATPQPRADENVPVMQYSPVVEIGMPTAEQKEDQKDKSLDEIKHEEMTNPVPADSEQPALQSEGLMQPSPKDAPEPLAVEIIPARVTSPVIHGGSPSSELDDSNLNGQE